MSNQFLRHSAPQRSFYARFGPLVMIALWAALPFVGWGALQAHRGSTNHIEQWLPRNLPERETYEWFRRRFGSDEFAIVSWDGCRLDDAQQMRRLESFARAAGRATADQAALEDISLLKQFTQRIYELAGEAPQRGEAGRPLFHNEVLTGPAVIDTMHRRLGVSRREAAKRLAGVLVGPDGQTTCALLRLSDAGRRDRVAAYHAIRQTARGVGVPDEAVHIGGDAIFNAAIDLESHAAITGLMPASVAVTLLIVVVALRSVRLGLMVAAIAAYAGAAAQAAVHYTGATMNLVLVVMPVLVYVLALSASVHVVNYYRDTAAKRGPRDAERRAVALGWTPCMLAAVTTVIGLLSLTISHIEPVVRFGQFGAAGVALGLAFVFGPLPVLLHRYPPRVGVAAEGAAPPGAGVRDRPISHALCRVVLAGRTPLLLLCLAALIGVGAGVTQTRTSVRAVRFFAPDSQVVRDVEWIERYIGPLVPIEVVIEFEPPPGDESNAGAGDPLTLLARMNVIDRIEKQIASMDVVGGTMSAATFRPTLSAAGRADGGDDPPGAVQLRAALLQYRYLSEPGESAADGRQAWRITARAPGLSQFHYDDVLAQIEQRIQQTLSPLRQAAPAQIDVHLTGAVPLVHAAQKELLAGLFRSFLMAFALIGVVMMLLLRGVRAGMLSMLPNVFPALIIFGAMGWLGHVVDIGAMLTASVAMGIAVDDTLHYLTWFRRAARDGATKREAITTAFQRCAAAMMQTTAIAGLGLAVFSFCDFQPVSQFGLLMCLMLAAALVGDLVLLPTLLSTRMGDVFLRRLSPGTRSPTIDAAPGAAPSAAANAETDLPDQ